MKKGIILAGGKGTRLAPLTNITNKHLLPVYDLPMIYYPLKTLLEAEITDIMIVTGTEHAGAFINLLGNGSQLGCKLTYSVQDRADGIAGAISLCEDFCKDESFAVILGDNIFENNMTEAVKNHNKDYAGIFLKEVLDPERFGVATVKDDMVIKIIEKPRAPETDLAVTGLYFYTKEVWNVIKSLKPSRRGELEVTDINNWYVERNLMKHQIIEGFWSDSGTHESLYKASTFIRSKKNI